MNTVSYTDNASRVPVEGPGRFFLPLPSINLPLSGFSAESAGGLEPRGLQPYRHATTFHHLPPQVEGAPKKSAQQPRGFQRCRRHGLPLLPDVPGEYAPQTFLRGIA
ncbi:hypothetical protein [Pseudomonas phage PaBSM-2607-JFK]|nr:hypothetical protein [Pseudomonas phage PaBSM-2607-JFK]